MVKKRIDRKIMQTAITYVAEVKKHYSVDDAILFGSFAVGHQHEGSDIDIAIVSKDIKNTFDDSLKMTRLRRGIDVRIEPHPIRTEDYRKNATQLTNEIRKTGFKIPA